MSKPHKKSHIKIIYKDDLFKTKKYQLGEPYIQKELFYNNNRLPIISDRNYTYVIVPESIFLYKKEDSNCFFIKKKENSKKFKTSKPLKLVNISDINNIINIIQDFKNTYNIKGFIEDTLQSAIYELIFLYEINNKIDTKLINIDYKSYNSFVSKINNQEGIKLQLLKNLFIIFYKFGIDGYIIPNVNFETNDICTIIFTLNEEKPMKKVNSDIETSYIDLI